jgi:CARDB
MAPGDDMAPPDDDIQFDFFDEEPPTAEAASQSRVRMPQRPRRRPRAGGGRGGGSHTLLGPIGRLAFVVFVIIGIALLFALLISSCTESKHSGYANYMSDVDTIGTQSTSNGKQTISALTTPGLTAAQISTKLAGIASEEQQNVDSAQKLSPPGKLRSEDANMIQALQLRVSGVNGLSKAFASAGTGTKQSLVALDVVQQTYRLLASDVMWDDLFQAPSEQVLTDENVHGVTVPSSHFLAEPELVITTRAVTSLLNRINQNGGGGKSGTAAGLHGTNIVSVAALPNGPGGTSETLSEGSLNTVTSSSSLAFQVTIHNGGISQEVQVKVTLVIARPSPKSPITKTETVQLIDPGQDQTVTFSDIGDVPFASQTKVTVDVAAVPHETNLSNNSAQYQVIFSLP